MASGAGDEAWWELEGPRSVARRPFLMPAWGVAFLCRLDASYIHGSIYYIDGGIHAKTRPDHF